MGALYMLIAAIEAFGLAAAGMVRFILGLASSFF